MAPLAATSFVILALLLLLPPPALGQDIVEESKPLVLTVYHSMYVTLLVGSSGREVTMRLRPDLNDIVLYSPPNPSDYSTTVQFDALGGATEVFYVGSSMYRWPVTYRPQGDPDAHDPDETSGHVNHHGVLGLGPTSPLWRQWNSYTWSSMQLTLGGQSASLSHTRGVIRYDPEDASQRLVTCWTIDGHERCASLVPSPEKDFTYMSPDVFAEWLASPSNSLQIYRTWKENATTGACSALSGGERACPASGPVIELYIDSDSIDDNELPMSKVQLSYADDSYVIAPGLEHLSSMIISRDLITGQVAIASMPMWFLRCGDYIWILAALAALFVIWFPGTYEHVHAAHWRTNESARATRRARPDPYIDSQLWISRISLWFGLLAMQWMIKPYYAMRMIHHPYANTAGWADVVYSFLAFYALLVTVFSVPKISRVSVSHVASALLYLLWMVAVPEFYRGLNCIAMIISSGFVFVLQCDLLSYSLYRRSGRPRSLSTVLVGALCVALSGCFYAFYTVAFYIQQTWPDHPYAVAIEALLLGATWMFGSFLPFVDEHHVQYQAYAKRVKEASRNRAKDKSTPAATTVVVHHGRHGGSLLLNPETPNSYSPPVIAIQ